MGGAMRRLALSNRILAQAHLARVLAARHALIARELPTAALLESFGLVAPSQTRGVPRPYIPSPQTLREIARVTATAREPQKTPAAPARTPPLSAPRWPAPRETRDDERGLRREVLLPDELRAASAPDALTSSLERSDEPVSEATVSEDVGAGETPADVEVELSATEADVGSIDDPTQPEVDALELVQQAPPPEREVVSDIEAPIIVEIEDASERLVKGVVADPDTAPAAPPREMRDASALKPPPASDAPNTRSAHDTPARSPSRETDTTFTPYSDAAPSGPASVFSLPEDVPPTNDEVPDTRLTPPIAASHVARTESDSETIEPPLARASTDHESAAPDEQVIAQTKQAGDAEPQARDASTTTQSPVGTEHPIEERRARRAPVPPARAEPPRVEATASLPEPDAPLFQPPERARSAQAWLEKLRSAAAVDAKASSSPVAEAASKSEAAKKAAVRQAPPKPTSLPVAKARPVTADPSSQPTRVSESTRRVLRPLVGIDPATVRIHRDDAVDRVLTSHHADALAIGDDVAIASGVNESTPEGLGVIAHELLHVARRREPRFVPPVLQGSPGERSPAAPFGSARRLSAADSADEERDAVAVESRVRSQARRAATSVGTSGDTEPVASHVATKVPDEPEAAPRSSVDPWGGLPAPWEPLPDLGSATPLAGPSSPVAGFAPTNGMNTEVASPSSKSGVRFAEQSRQVPDESHAAPRDGGGGKGAAPEPNIDALARQVYDVLRRRLAAERRRGA
jgi:uncharacterized protein DUF4157